MEHISKVLDRLFDQIDYVQQHRGEVVGVATGFSDLDQLTAGFQPSDLIVIAGARSIGKTSLVLGVMYGAAVGHDKTVAMFSPEMSLEQLIQRVLSMETGVDTRRLRLGQIDDNEWDRISRAFGRLCSTPIYIDVSKVLTVEDIRFKSRRLQAEQGLDMILIDDLQMMMTQRRENRFEEISETSRDLKRLARELRVPIVVVSRISNVVERRANHRPTLDDLRVSGSLADDADLVIFVYRDDQYEAASEKRGGAEIIVAKHRNGPIGSINLRFFERTARFADLELYPTSASQ
jgi:replicative DNA helicase